MGGQKGGCNFIIFSGSCLTDCFSGMSPSTQRAVIMVSLFLLTFLFEREHDLMNTLALAAMLILILHPPALFSISFQLSFSAVLSIVYGLSQTKNFRLQKKNSTLKKRLSIRNKFFTFMLVSFFCHHRHLSPDDVILQSGFDCWTFGQFIDHSDGGFYGYSAWIGFGCFKPLERHRRFNFIKI